MNTSVLQRMRTLVVCVLFFASGSAAVVFEMLWFHQARLVLGSSVWATALVPAGFMAGLGVGNGIAMLRGDRVRHPLRAYAALEILVAVSGVSLVFGLPGLASVLTPAARPLLDTPVALAVLRLSTAFVLLLLPSTAMGLTLPLVVRALSASHASFGRVLGRLYGWNTLGAVAGALIAEIHLVGSLGVRGAALAAGALNLFAACAALLLTVRSSGFGLEAPKTARVGVSRTTWRRLAAAALAGGTLLALEVIWIRFLSLYVLTASLAFAVMLAIVLAGIGIGGLAGSHWLRLDARAHRFLAPAALAAGLLTGITYAAFPWVVRACGFALARDAWQIAALGAPLMLPVSLASGVIFTLLGAALRAETRGDAVAVGLLTLFNTAGASVGALVAGFVLLPMLGMERSLFALTISYAALAALLGIGDGRARGLSYVLGAVFVVSAACFPFGSMQRVHFAARMARWAQDGEPRGEVREGLGETILYVERRFAGRTRSHRLVTNGFSMSSSDFRNRRYMKLFVYLPMAVHPAPKDALLICFGVGATAKALTDSRELETIDIVDVSRDILEMSRVVYPDPQTNPIHDPRVRLHVEDGRFFLQTTDRHFDVITGEPPPPNIDGAETLYSVEYFHLLHDRLRDGGIATYWLPTHSLAEKNALSVVRAFCDVFEDCSIWGGFGTDLILVGTRAAQGGVTEARFTAQWHDARIAEELAALGIERPEQLGALFMGDAPYLGELTSGVLPVVDDFPRRVTAPPFFSSYNTSGVGLYGEWPDAGAARARFAKSALIGRLWPPGMLRSSLEYFSSQAALSRFAYRSSLRLSANMADAHEVLTTTTLRTPVLWMLGSDGDVQRILRELPPEALASPLNAYHVGCREISERRFEDAAARFETASLDREMGAAALVLRAYALFMAGDRFRAEAAVVHARTRLFDEESLQLLIWLERTFATSEQRE